MDSEALTHKQKIMQIRTKNLFNLEEQAAQYGMDIPIRLQNQIDNERRLIESLEEEIQLLQGSVVSANQVDNIAHKIIEEYCSNFIIQNSYFVPLGRFYL